MTIHKNTEGAVSVELESSVRELIDIMRHEIRSFNALLELLILEEKGLVECDNALLRDVLERQEDLLNSLACLEKTREGVTAHIAGHMGETSAQFRVSRLARHLTGPLKREVIDTAHVLGKIYDQLQEKKSTNTLLIRQGALMVESTLRYLVRAVGRSAAVIDTYTPQAAHGGLSGSISLDGRM